MRSIQSHVKSVTSKDYPDNTMDIWLSLNTGNDSTAIWLEQKFGMPSSGNWHSENVFSMPISQSPAASSQSLSPVVIVFERTPATDVDDPIERYVPHPRSQDLKKAYLIHGFNTANIAWSMTVHVCEMSWRIFRIYPKSVSNQLLSSSSGPTEMKRAVFRISLIWWKSSGKLRWWSLLILSRYHLKTRIWTSGCRSC